MVVSGKRVVGLIESVTLIDTQGNKRTLKAKMDTGATRSSIDVSLTKEMDFGPELQKKLVKSAHGSAVRPAVEANIEFASQKFKTEFTVADRSHLKYKLLIGVNVLQHGFLIDPSKK
ncbi:MAG: RimK/LysX family protein [Nanoarchaeota archaeon]|nr:RimK/LysX family protein [Nanoarchaeota archaeon]